MLGKFLLQGLVAAGVIAWAAAVYAQTAGEAPPAAPAPQQARPALPADRDGYLPVPSRDQARRDGHHDRDRRHDRRHKERDHDDDD